jgi:hypothetical protein
VTNGHLLQPVALKTVCVTRNIHAKRTCTTMTYEAGPKIRLKNGVTPMHVIDLADELNRVFRQLDAGYE